MDSESSAVVTTSPISPFYVQVVFAGDRYKADAPNAWDALMESRFRGGVYRIQFALAGINAHINHDLAFALIETNRESNINPNRLSPQYADYDVVNQLLQEVMPRPQRPRAGILASSRKTQGRSAGCSPSGTSSKRVS
jgi:hypothetical protein